MNDNSAREPSHKNVFSEHACGETRLQSEGETASSFQSLPVVTSTQTLHCFAPCTWRRSVKCSSSATTRKVDPCARPEHRPANRTWFAFGWAEPLQYVHGRSCSSRTEMELCDLWADSWQSDHKDSTAAHTLRFTHWQWSNLFSSWHSPAYEHQTRQIHFFGWFQHLVELIVAQQAKKTRAKEQEVAHPVASMHHDKNCKEPRWQRIDRCRSQLQGSGWGACSSTSTSRRSQRPRHDTGIYTRIFIVALRMRQFFTGTIETMHGFVFAGWGGGGHNVKRPSIFWEKSLLWEACPRFEKTWSHTLPNDHALLAKGQGAGWHCHCFRSRKDHQHPMSLAVFKKRMSFFIHWQTRRSWRVTRVVRQKRHWMCERPDLAGQSEGDLFVEQELWRQWQVVFSKKESVRTLHELSMMNLPLSGKTFKFFQTSIWSKCYAKRQAWYGRENFSKRRLASMGLEGEGGLENEDREAGTFWKSTFMCCACSLAGDCTYNFFNCGSPANINLGREVSLFLERNLRE